MLVLSRRDGERIQIGPDVHIVVVRIGPNSVRLGIEAPKEMNIIREELLPRNETNGQTTDGRSIEDPQAGGRTKELEVERIQS